MDQKQQRLKSLVSQMNEFSDEDSFLEKYITDVMNIEDFKDKFQEEQDKLKNEAFQDLFKKFEESTQLMSTASRPSESASKSRPKSSQKMDFKQMKDVQDKIVRIQAFFRRELTLKKIQQMIQKERQTLNNKRANETPEETVLKEFVSQLQKKKVTPEAFYRICDKDYIQQVRVDVFKDNLIRFGLQLSRGQLSRLIMILDEDLEGTITKGEYYNALEAYSLHREKHNTDGSYVPFELRVMFKLVADLQSKDITYLQMFNCCDINEDARVDIKEVRKFVEGLSPDFRVKELHALMGFLDIDRNGIVDKDEFLRQMQKAEQQQKQQQITQRSVQSVTKMRASSGFDDLARDKDDDMFEEEEVDGGDQAFFSGWFGGDTSNKGEQNSSSKVNKGSEQKPSSKMVNSAKSSSNVVNSTKKNIVQKMEQEGQSIKSFFNQVKNTVTDGTAKVGSLMKHIDQSFPSITMKEKYHLIKDSLVGHDRVDMVKFEQTLQKNGAKNLDTSVNQTFSVIANLIVKKIGTNGADGIKQFFKVQGFTPQEQLSEMEFSSIFTGRKFQTNLTEQNLEEAFESLNIHKDGFIVVQDLIDTLTSYISGSSEGGKDLTINMKNLNTIIKGYESMSPRTRRQEINEYLIQELKQKKLQPLNVYKMADVKNQGSISQQALIETFSKLLPQIKSEVFQESIKSFSVKSTKDPISKEDFQIVFSTDQQSPSKQSKQIQVQSNLDLDPTVISLLKQLDSIMLRQGISPSVAFKAADLNNNNVITRDELRETLKKLLPESALSLADLQKVMIAFDQNKNGLIEEKEYLDLFDKVRNLNGIVVKDVGGHQNDGNNDRRGQLPTKGNMNVSKGKISDQDLQKLVGNLQKRIDFKEAMGELSINEQGQVASNSLGRVLKQIAPFNNKALQPNEYMDIIKYIDSNNEGRFSAKDLVKFCDKYVTNNEQNFIFELKFIANFLEYQQNNKDTAQYFSQILNIKDTDRLKEVDIQTEFFKRFSISTKIVRAMFVQLDTNKQGKFVILQDLAQLIDQYRAVQLPSFQQKKTQSSQVNADQAMLEFFVNLYGLQDAIKDQLNQKLEEGIRKNKGISFNLFFTIFVEDYNLSDNNKIKAIFEQLKFTSKATSNVINHQVLVDMQEKYYQQIKNAQYLAFKGKLKEINEQFTFNMSKLKISQYGNISKKQFLEELKILGVLPDINKDNSQKNYYIVSLRQLLGLSNEFIFANKLQASNFLSECLVEQSELCQFWVILDLLCRISDQGFMSEDLFLKYLGRVFDLLANNQLISAYVTQKCSTFQQIPTPSKFTNFIQKIDALYNAQPDNMSQGIITERVTKYIEQIYNNHKDLKMNLGNEKDAFIQKINKHRGKGAKQTDVFDEEEVEEGDEKFASEEPSNSEIISSIEKQMKCTFEQFIEDSIKPSDELISIVVFKKKFLTKNPQIDKQLLQKFAEKIDIEQTHKIQLRDFILFLAENSSKFNKEDCLNQIIGSCKNNVRSTLSNLQFMQGDDMNFIEFAEKIGELAPLSKFQSYAVFYNICNEDNFIDGGQFIKLVEDQEKKNKNKKSTAPSTGKKGVKFQDLEEEKSQRKPISQKSQQLVQQFIKDFSQINGSTFNTAFQNLNDDAPRMIKALKPHPSLQLSDLYSILTDQGFLDDELEILVVLFSTLDLSDIEQLQVKPSVLIQFVQAKMAQAQSKELFAFLKQVYTQLKQKFSVPSTPEQMPVKKQAEEVKQQPQKPVAQKKESFEKDDTAALKKELKDILPQLEQKILRDPAVLQKLNGYFDKQNGRVSQKQLYNLLKTANIRAPEKQIEQKIYPQQYLLFCLEFSLPFKYDVQKFKKPEIKYDMKGSFTYNVQSFLEHTIIPERDYFRGIPSILNGEKAALIVAEKLFNECKGDVFFDKDFGPINENDETGNKLALYFDGTPPRGYVQPENVVWLYPEGKDGFLDEGVKAQFIDDGASSNDVRQGQIGDCWFIGALSVIATRDELLRGGLANVEVDKNMKIDKKTTELLGEGVYPPLFHMYRKKGIYVLRFHKDFQWRYVIIDERLPCKKMDYRPVFATCKELHEMWVPYIEKAYAKLHGCYETLISGFIDDGLDDMTGLVSMKLKLHDNQEIFPNKAIGDKDKFWAELMKYKKQGCLMGCSVAGDTERQIMIDGEPAGIMTGHAYGICDILEMQRQDHQDKKHRLLRIRNPWGKTEWKGKWSDNSDEVTEKYKDLLDAYLASLEEEERFVPGEDDGTFLINYQNWRDIYNNMFISMDFPDEWSAVRFESQWDQKCSGGTPSPMTDQTKKQWGNNPQFLLEPDEDCQIYIQLAQNDGRYMRKDEHGKTVYDRYPYKSLIYPICFTVCKLGNDKRMEIFDKSRIHAVSIFRESKEVSLMVDLKAGERYAIVCQTRSVGQYGKFYLSLYFNCTERTIEIQRIGPNNDIKSNIEEETENYENQEQWKTDLMQQRLQFMIEDNDLDLSQLEMNSEGKIRVKSIVGVVKQKNMQSQVQLNQSNASSVNTSFQQNAKPTQKRKQQKQEDDDEVLE